MNQDRTGTALMLAAVAWLVMLVFTEPGVHADPWFRVLVGTIAFIVLVTAFFPRHLFLTGTVLAFVSLGMTLHIGLFGLFGLGITGLVPPALIAISLWLRRDRLDGDAVVVVTAVAACGLSMVQPRVIIIAIVFIAVVNLLIWIVNRTGAWRQRPVR